MLRLHALIALALCALMSAASHGAEWRMVGAGGATRAWVIHPVETPTGRVNDERELRGQVFHISVDGQLGDVMILRAHSVYEAPLVATAHDDRFVLIYPPAASSGTNAEDDAATERMYPIRQVAILETGSGTIYVDPPDRYGAEPPLKLEGELVSAADTALGLIAMERTRGEARLHALTRDGWSELQAPELSGDVIIRAHKDGVALLTDGVGETILWTLHSLDGQWNRSTLASEALTQDIRWTPGGWVGFERDDNAESIAFNTFLNGSSTRLATIEGVGHESAIVRVGENLAVLWMDESTPSRLRIAIVSSITGQTLYNDFASFGPPLTPADLRIVAFLLSAVMLGVLLFVLKPETPAQAAPPAGTALATPFQRAAAAMIDIGIAGLISAAIWRVPVAETIDPSYLLLMSGGDSWPVLTVMGIYFLHGVAGEWLFGRTIGKAALRCRVHSTRGDRFRLWQAAARNLIKVVAPPLVGLVLIDPARRHPGDLLGGSIIVTPSDEAPAETPPSDDEPDVR